MKWRLMIAALCCAACLFAQEDRDFMTANEVEQIREAQAPNDRLLLYVHFARQRMDLIEQYLAKDKPGRSIFIHNTLEDYTKIIEAIDSVADDALRHNRTVDQGMVAVIAAENEFLEKLNKISATEPRDFDRYKFVLAEAVDTTTDSHDLSLEDSKKRGSELSAKDAKEKSDRETMMSASEQKEHKRAAQQEQDNKKKVPTLLRKGEKPPDQQPQ